MKYIANSFVNLYRKVQRTLFCVFRMGWRLMTRKPPLAPKGNSPVRETPLIREMSRSDRGFAVFARKNVGFADKRVAAPAKGEVETEGFDRGDYPCIKDRSSQHLTPRRAGVYSCRNLSSV